MHGRAHFRSMPDDELQPYSKHSCAMHQQADVLKMITTPSNNHAPTTAYHILKCVLTIPVAQISAKTTNDYQFDRKVDYSHRVFFKQLRRRHIYIYTKYMASHGNIPTTRVSFLSLSGVSTYCTNAWTRTLTHLLSTRHQHWQHLKYFVRKHHSLIIPFLPGHY